MTEESNYRGNEKWKQHPTLPIQVSTLGRVRMGDRILTPRIDRHTSQRLRGYVYSRVFIRGFGRRHVHRLVAETWIKRDLTSNECVCHKDETIDPKLMNSVFNLWIGTKSENSKDRHRKGRSDGGQPRKHPITIVPKVFALKKLGLICREIADILSIEQHLVYNYLHRDTDTNHYVNES